MLHIYDDVMIWTHLTHFGAYCYPELAVEYTDEFQAIYGRQRSNHVNIICYMLYSLLVLLILYDSFLYDIIDTKVRVCLNVKAILPA